MTYFNPYQYSSMSAPYSFAQQTSQQLQPYQQQQSGPPQMDGARWVLGESAAKSYNVQPGHMAILMDSEDSVFYMKAVDPYGVPQPLRKFRFTEITDELKKIPENSHQAPPVDTSKYITKEEFEQTLKEKLEELMK